MAEVNAALQQLLHVDYAQNYSSLFFPPPDSFRQARRLAATSWQSSRVCFSQRILAHFNKPRKKDAPTKK
jgi:hypothetical protein